MNKIFYKQIVVVPVYNEDVEDVVRVIHSVAVQRYMDEDIKECAVVININNSKSESIDKECLVYKTNLYVYNFLKTLKESVEDGNEKLTSYLNAESGETVKKVSDINKSIQNNTLFLEVIDTFSPEHAQEINTLGLAREVAFRYAIKHLACDRNTLLFSTDADSFFGVNTMSSVQKMFSDHEIDFGTLNMEYHFNNLDDHSSQAAVRYRISRQIENNLFKILINYKTTYSPHAIATSTLLKKAFNLGGAYTVIRSGAYEKSEGYPNVASKEDLYIAASIAKTGSKIKDLSGLYPSAVVYTSPRISHRVPEGYGRKIEKFATEETDFLKYSVASVDVRLSLHVFIRKVEQMKTDDEDITIKALEKLSSKECPWLTGELKRQYLSDLSSIFKNDPTKQYSKAHWDLSNKTKKLLRSKVVPQQTIAEQVVLLENIYKNNQHVLMSDLIFDLSIHNKDLLNYDAVKNVLFNNLKLINGLNIDLVKPIVTPQIASLYENFFLKGFKEKVASNPRNKIDINIYQSLINEFEQKVLNAVRYGYSGIISCKVIREIEKRIEQLKKS
jgi:hypothetical protein